MREKVVNIYDTRSINKKNFQLFLAKGVKDNGQNYIIVSYDFYKNGILDDNDNEIANNILRKLTILNENKIEKNRTKNNDTRFKNEGKFNIFIEKLCKICYNNI